MDEMEIDEGSIGSVPEFIDKMVLRELESIVSSPPEIEETLENISDQDSDWKMFFTSLEKSIDQKGEIYQHLQRVKHYFEDAPAIAAREGFADLVAIFVKYGLPVNSRYKNKRTLLHYATEGGNVNLVYFLVSRGADVDAREINGWTVLHIASRKGNLNLVKLLMLKSKSINTRDSNLRPPLHYAVESSNLELVKYLISKDADVNIKDIDNKTVLHVAAATGNVELLRFLLEKGLYVNERDYNHCTPLHDAVSAGSFQSTFFLLNNGANADYETEFNITPLHAAVINGNPRIVQLLLQRGAKAESLVFQNGGTLLHWAAGIGDVLLVHKLAHQFNLDLTAKDNFGRTPIMMANTNGHVKVMEYIIKWFSRDSDESFLNTFDPWYYT